MTGASLKVLAYVAMFFAMEARLSLASERAKECLDETTGFAKQAREFLNSSDQPKVSDFCLVRVFNFQSKVVVVFSRLATIVDRDGNETDQPEPVLFTVEIDEKTRKIIHGSFRRD
jgi:hypothetical protein